MNAHHVLRHAGLVLAAMLTVRAFVFRRFAALDHEVTSERSFDLVGSAATWTPEIVRVAR